jgi:hypothetical protein
MNEDTEARLRLLTEGFRQALAETQRNLAGSIEAKAALRAEVADLRQQLAQKEHHAEVLNAELERKIEEIEAIHRSLSWRLTFLLRLGKGAPRRIWTKANRAMREASRRARRSLLSALRPTAHWVIGRPRLFMLLNRMLAVHPKFRALIKERLVASDGGRTETNKGDALPIGALAVLRDLERAVADSAPESRASSRRDSEHSGP